MKIHQNFLSGFALLCFVALGTPSWAQPPGTTPPVITTDIPWPEWSLVTTVAQVEAQFNSARRSEESQRSLPANTLGNLDLPSDYFSRPMEEQAWILLKAEREARHLVNYPGTGVVTGYLPEGVEASLSAVAQGHADEMANCPNFYFSHNSKDGTSSGSRIRGAFASGCSQGTGENIAWNSWDNGHLVGVPLAFYNFIYDDWSCCSGGHRNLCLRQTGFNNYGDPNRLGIVGFGRGASSQGDFFVMAYMDPDNDAGCSYYIETYEDCNLPAIVNVNGALYSNTHLAENTVNSDGTVMSGQLVTFKAGQEINLQTYFEVQANTTFIVEIEDCPSGGADVQHTGLHYALKAEEMQRQIRQDGIPRFKRSHIHDLELMDTNLERRSIR